MKQNLSASFTNELFGGKIEDCFGCPLSVDYARGRKELTERFDAFDSFRLSRYKALIIKRGIFLEVFSCSFADPTLFGHFGSKTAVHSRS